MSERASSSPREHLVAFASLAPRVARASWVGGVVLAIGLAATAIWALSTSRLYRSEAVILYERGVQSATGPQGDAADAPRLIGTKLHDMVMSRQRLEAVIKDMRLYPSIVEQRSIVDAIDEMRKHLTVTGREGYTFRVSFDADRREVAQQGLDRLTKSVVDDDARQRMRDAQATKVFLDSERKHADEDMRAKESAMSTFLTLHPQLAPETGTGAASTGAVIRAATRDQAPASSGAEVASLELQAASLEGELAAAGMRPGAGPSEAPLDPMLAGMRSRAYTELQTAQRDLAEKQNRYTNEHPDVKAALRRVTDATAAVRRADEAAAAPRSATHEGATPEVSMDPEGGRIGALRRALAAVRAQIGAVRGRSAPRAEIPQGSTSVVAIDTEWTRLARQVSEARDRQTQLEAKQFQAELLATLAAGGQGGRLVVVDPPFRPLRPIAGGRLKIALLGGVASLLLSILGIGLLAAFDDRLYSARDIERIVNDGIVVVVPRLTAKGG
jgi:hypothetical protein